MFLNISPLQSLRGLNCVPSPQHTQPLPWVPVGSCAQCGLPAPLLCRPVMIWDHTYKYQLSMNWLEEALPAHRPRIRKQISGGFSCRMSSQCGS